MITWFHEHQYDPEKWTLVDWRPQRSYSIANDEKEGKEHVWRNTCIRCGDLVFSHVIPPEKKR